MNNNDDDKIVYTKEDIVWYYASMYLERLLDTAACKDEEFMRLYNQLCEYVDSKISSPYGGDIVETCVLVGRKFK